MNEKELVRQWQAEEDVAHIHGWDFSHIDGRYTEQKDLPWSYVKIMKKYLEPSMRVLDIDTGGGELLLSLKHPYENTSVTEGYPPNVELCKKTLIPLGIEVKEATDYAHLPFPDESFDIVINNHGDFNSHEIHRILKKGGVFITQQVGEDNDRELVELLLPETPKPFHGLNLKNQRENFEQAGFRILEADEAYRPIRFFDVGALVWFARIIEWEFPGFSVENCKGNLLKAQKMIESKGSVDGMIHRYLLVAEKK